MVLVETRRGPFSSAQVGLQNAHSTEDQVRRDRGRTNASNAASYVVRDDIRGLTLLKDSGDCLPDAPRIDEQLGLPLQESHHGHGGAAAAPQQAAIINMLSTEHGSFLSIPNNPSALRADAQQEMIADAEHSSVPESCPAMPGRNRGSDPKSPLDGATSRYTRL